MNAKQKPTRRQLEVLRAYIRAGSMAAAACEVDLSESRARRLSRAGGRRAGDAHPGVADVLDYLDVGPEFGVVKVRVPAACVGRTLADVDLRGRFEFTPVAIRRDGKVTVIPHRDERLGSSDELILLGRDDHLERLGGWAAR